MLPLFAAIGINSASAQNTFRAILTDNESHEPLIGATGVLEGTTIGSTSDLEGVLTIENIPNGEHILFFSYLGYETMSDTFYFPMNNEEPVEIELDFIADELDEVVISSTRSTRTIQEIPTRMEFIGLEELGEKANMKAGDIRMLLSESTGIQTQVTSATSGNASIRIQGLDGRYTQILKDGFPLFSGAASGLGLLQTPPLDLKQVEVIKGSASTLYGGGAIAGLINLISKTPTEERDLLFHMDANSGKGFDLNGFYSKRFKKVGTTIFASHNRSWAYDPAGIGFSAIPQYERYVLNPKLFLYFNEKTKLNFGVNTTIEDRLGGDLLFIEGQGDSIHSYFEENTTQRFSTQMSLDHQTGSGMFNFKNSVSYFNRIISVPDYNFDGTQTATFTEASYARGGEKFEWVTGVNLWTDQFDENQLDSFQTRDYDLNTLGAFAQSSWKATDWLNLETGLRTDYVLDYGLVLLPRVSSLIKISPKLSSRIGGGFGYKPPTIFTEESERLQFQNVIPISNKINELEKSYGGNFDINYKTIIGEEISFSMNQLLFYTYIDKPLVLELQPNGLYQFLNVQGYIDTKGTETNIKIGYDDFKLFLGYTYTDARLIQNGVALDAPLTPKHRINSVLFYEVEEKWKIGLEAYYYSPQTLNDGSKGKQYVIAGFMIEKLWENFSIYLNFENFLDARQTRFDTIYTGTVTNPHFQRHICTSRRLSNKRRD